MNSLIARPLRKSSLQLSFKTSLLDPRLRSLEQLQYHFQRSNWQWSPMFILPVELLHHILDFHEGDTFALQSYSLVSSIWKREAQRRLLTRVFILVAVPGRTLEDFQSCFNTSESEPLSYIRDVYMQNHAPKGAHSFRHATPHITVNELCQATALLPRLRLLDIGPLSLVGDASSSALASSNSSISQIKLHTLRLWSTCFVEGSFRDFIGWFSEIDTLVVDAAYFFCAKPALPISPVRVRLLDFECPGKGLVPELLRSIYIADMHSLRIGDNARTVSAYYEQYQLCINAFTSIGQLEMCLPHSESTGLVARLIPR